VGDEKDEDEADTIGSTTLRPEHIKIKGSEVTFKFLGKDCVPFERTVKMPASVIFNLQEFLKEKNGQLFAGVSSTDVNAFLKESMDGLTAKVFRTYLATKVVSDYLSHTPIEVVKKMPESEKALVAKMANLDAAITMNHQRKVPKNYEETTEKKREKLAELVQKIQAKKSEKSGGKAQKLEIQAEKIAADILIRDKSREFNLNTSLRSYIDPRVYADWSEQVGFDFTKLYPKTLLRKFAWALQQKS
jgi:DNA topoisomerase-1